MVIPNYMDLCSTTAYVGEQIWFQQPSFVTQEDIIAMLENEVHMSSDDWKYVPEPPYPISLLHMLYPKGYETLNLVLFDGKKGSPKEHISRFIDALGPHASDYNLCLMEFLKSLTNYTYI
ncbi:unnamed protein product [Malus baccata var. baccata]